MACAGPVNPASRYGCTHTTALNPTRVQAVYQHEYVEGRNFNLLEIALHPIVAYNIIMKAKHAFIGAITNMFAKLVPSTRTVLPQQNDIFYIGFAIGCLYAIA